MERQPSLGRGLMELAGLDASRLGGGEKDLSEARRLFQSSEVSGVVEIDPLRSWKERMVGLPFGHLRPVVIAIDEGHGHVDASVEVPRGDHAVDVAEDCAGHASVASPTADSSQLCEVVVRQLVPV